MQIRNMALALPLAFGIACASKQHANNENRVPAPAGTQASAQGSPGSVGNDAEGGAPTTATPDQTNPNRDMSGATASGGTATMSGSSSDLKGHDSDQVMMGKVAQISSKEISIQHMGESQTLQVVPQTVITVDGRDARISDIKQGEPVRASFNQQNGKNVAVKIEAGRMSMMGGSGMGGDTGTTGTGTGTPTEQGAPGSSTSGSSSTSDMGTSSGSTGATGTGTGGGYDTSGTRR